MRLFRIGEENRFVNALNLSFRAKFFEVILKPIFEVMFSEAWNVLIELNFYKSNVEITVMFLHWPRPRRFKGITSLEHLFRIKIKTEMIVRLFKMCVFKIASCRIWSDSCAREAKDKQSYVGVVCFLKF